MISQAMYKKMRKRHKLESTKKTNKNMKLRCKSFTNKWVRKV